MRSYVVLVGGDLAARRDVAVEAVVGVAVARAVPPANTCLRRVPLASIAYAARRSATK